MRRPRAEVPELEAGRLRHHARAPGRVPDQVELHVRDARDSARLGLDLGRQRLGHGAHGRGERHADLHAPPRPRRGRRSARAPRCPRGSPGRRRYLEHVRIDSLRLLQLVRVSYGSPSYSVFTVVAPPCERGAERVPGERRALHAHRVLPHARERRELADGARVGLALRARWSRARGRRRRASAPRPRCGPSRPGSSARRRRSRSRSRCPGSPRPSPRRRRAARAR